MSYKEKVGSLFKKGVQTTKIIPTLVIEDSGDIMTQNIGKPVKNTVGAQ